MKLFVALFALVAVAAAQVSNEYLPPNYGGDFNPSEASYSVAASAPAASYETYDVGASAPAHSFSDADGYRYKTHRRRVVKVARRHRRGVSTEYLPPAASAPSNEYLAPVASYSAPAASYSAPAASYSESYNVGASAPAASYESYDVGASAPAHSYSDAEGYRYKTQRRRVVKVARRHRRGVSTEYLPPAASAPSNEYLAPVASYSAPAASYAAPVESYSVGASAPGVSFESYETAGTAPAHSYSEAEGYRYKTQRRRVVKVARRHRRGVSTEYLPPAASAPSNEYLAPVASYSAPAASYAAPSYSESYSVGASAPAASYESYDVGASAPAHSYSDAEGYRYKTQRRRVVKVARRHRRDVSTEYLPPVASAPAASFAQPAASYSSASYSTPAGSYSIESASPGGIHETFETAGAAPAHSFSDADGYRYKTARRRVIRRRQ